MKKIKLKFVTLSGVNTLTGLIGVKKPKAVFFKTHWGIHTFGLRFPIDILILDNENKVVKIKENLKPFRLFLWNPKFNSVLELPEGTVKNDNISIGDQIINQIDRHYKTNSK